MTTQKQRQAVRRMESAFDLIVNYEDAWRQDRWRDGSKTSACGTAMCFAGWAVADSPYKPVVPRPLQFAETWDSYQDGNVGDLMQLAVVPADDPLASSFHRDWDVDDLTWNARFRKAVRRLWPTKKSGDVVVQIGELAENLLDVKTTRNRGGILSEYAFESHNSLRGIRSYIDEARKRAGLKPRNFAREPVNLRLDNYVPAALHDTIRQRVADFNERARAGVICTEDGR